MNARKYESTFDAVFKMGVGLLVLAGTVGLEALRHLH